MHSLPDFGSMTACNPDRTASRKYDPKPHQRIAIAEVCKGFQTSDRGQLIMPCATGKTLVGIETAYELECTTVLVLAPTIILLAQLLREWTAQLGNFDYLCVCSDDTVDAETKSMASEFLSEMLHVTTDVSDIKRFLESSTVQRKIVFTTYQSFCLIKSACQEISCKPHFDLAVADEAHHCAGWFGKPFAAILNGHVTIRKRLFMTATPRYIIPSGNRSEPDILSMDDQNAFGPVFHKLSFSQAIKLDLLCDYQVAIIAVHPDVYREELNAKIVSGTLCNDTDILRYQACHIAIADAMRQCNLRNVVSYHNRVDSARYFSQDFARYVETLPEPKRPDRPIWAAHISGDMDPDQRNGLLAGFSLHRRHATGLLSNSRCLTEGIDIPDIDGIIFVDPRKSSIDITQCIGRALRKKDHTKVATIIIPVFMKDEGDNILQVRDSEYLAVWDVLNTLGSIDDAMAQEIRDMNRFAGLEGYAKIKLPSKINQFASSRISPDLANRISIKIFKTQVATWDFMFGLLLRYVQREGTAQLPERHMEDGYALGVWVMKQRRSFKKNMLVKDRIQTLESLPGWVWSLRKPYFENGIDSYNEYLRKNGNGIIPRTHIDPTGFKLGEWLNEQKRRYRNGQLTDNQIKQLGDTSIWLTSFQHRSRDDAWFNGYTRLIRFEARCGHCQIPWNYQEEGFPLGRWVTIQRQNRRRGKLTEKQQELLSRIPGWVWEPAHNKWKEYFALLQEFRMREGHCNVPVKHREHGRQLGMWCQRQKRDYCIKKLSHERIRNLESLTGWAWSL